MKAAIRKTVVRRGEGGRPKEEMRGGWKSERERGKRKRCIFLNNKPYNSQP